MEAIYHRLFISNNAMLRSEFRVFPGFCSVSKSSGEATPARFKELNKLRRPVCGSSTTGADLERQQHHSIDLIVA